MLNFIYYPVSFILWCWHKVFGFVLGDASAVGWALSIVFLVFTLRAILLKPAIKQIRSMRKMQEFAPQMKAIQKKYANDRQRQAAEMQKLQREHGVSPLGGCLPMILQIPVFIGLNHVLRSFSIYPNNPNYFFPLSDVKSYLAAKLFGAHLGDAIFNTSLVAGGGVNHQTWEWGVAPVAIPLMIIAAVATHFTARLSAKRNMTMGGSSQSKMMSKLAMWVFPLGVLVFGGALPVGLLMYWVSNNVWTFGQQHLIFKQIAKEDEEKKRQAQEARDARAPKPGQKPTQGKKGVRPAGADQVQAEGVEAVDAAQAGAEAAGPPSKSGSGRPAGAKGGAKKGGARNDTGITNMPPTAKSGSPQAKNGSSQAKNGGKKAGPNGQKPGGSGANSGKQKQGAGTKNNGSGGSGNAVPGIISDRSRKKKQKR